MLKAMAAALVIVLPSVFGSWVKAAEVTGDPVAVDGGRIAGIWKANAAVRAYLGVPYAAPPVGALRWKRAQPAVPWDGVRHADTLGPECMQRKQQPDSLRYETYGDQPQSEDCLTMNVWAPPAVPGRRLPVIVWFYGGAFQRGSSGNTTYDGTGLARRGVVVVSFNYRVGVFGFLAHPALSAESPDKTSGNYGMLDQVAALEWVRRNADKFGGDPENVTVYGQSAGAASVNLLLASPLARNLFSRAIASSFGYFKSIQTRTAAERDGLAFAQKMHARSLTDLRSLAAADIVQSGVSMSPIVDGRFLTVAPHEVFLRGEEAPVPLLTGWNADEGTKYPFAISRAAFEKDTRERFGKDADRLLQMYPADSDEEAVTASLELTRDRIFAAGVFRTARLHARNGRAVFLYHFTRRSPFYGGQKFSEIDPAARFGAYHGTEVAYAFGTLDVLDRHFTQIDRDLSETLQSYWINFAYSGNPNGPGLPTWPMYRGGTDRVLQLGDTIAVDTVPHADRLELLDTSDKEGKPGG